MPETIPVFPLPNLELRYARNWTRRKQPFEKKDVLYFYHFTKCGGTSFYSFLSSFFSEDEIIPVERQYYPIDEWTETEWNSYRLYRHARHNFDFVKENCRPGHSIDLLRDPVRRVVSLYHYLRQPGRFVESNDELNKRFGKGLTAARNLSFEEWLQLESPRFGPPINHYTACLSCGPTTYAQASQQKRREYLKQAKRNLRDGFAFFGITERYKESKMLFCRSFGLPNHFAQGEEFFNSATRSRYTEEFSREVLARIEELNREDLELYQFACELFDERLAASDKWHEKKPKFPIESQPVPELTPAEMRGSGIYRQEFRPEGKSHRWTGSLPVTRLNFGAKLPSSGKLTIRFEIPFLLDPSFLEDIKVSFNESQAYLHPPSFSDEGTIYLTAETSLTRSIAKKHSHELAITCASEHPPTPPEGVADERTLGIALERISLTCKR